MKGRYVGPIGALRGETALLRPKITEGYTGPKRDYGVWLAQFDNRGITTSINGKSPAFGWHEFPAKHWKVQRGA